jgi:hypothetical protein
MSPVSDDNFARVVDRIVALERNHAVKDETMKGIEKRLDAIETILSRLTWLIVASVVGSVLAMVVYSGGIPGVTR